jgi:hypothetical protein
MTARFLRFATQTVATVLFGLTLVHAPTATAQTTPAGQTQLAGDKATPDQRFPWRVGFDIAGAAMPLQTYANDYPYGIGIFGRFEYGFHPNFAFNLRPGFIYHFIRSDKFQEIPILLGFKWDILDGEYRPYLSVEGGPNIIIAERFLGYTGTGVYGTGMVSAGVEIGHFDIRLGFHVPDVAKIDKFQQIVFSIGREWDFK